MCIPDSSRLRQDYRRREPTGLSGLLLAPLAWRQVAPRRCVKRRSGYAAYGKRLEACTILEVMDIDKAAETLDAHPDFRVLRRLCISDAHVFAENASGEPCGRLAVIDTETTGLKAELGDRIIDLAIATCEYGRETGRLYRVVDRYESLEDPETPILARNHAPYRH